jgi:outer membrane protein OmpA-like peptidoglycan-associated protein
MFALFEAALPRRNAEDMENAMKRLPRSTLLTIGTLLAACAGACAATQAPRELTDARSAYQRVQEPSNVAARFKPDQVHEAKVALDKAELSFQDDPKDQRTRDLAYIAQRKAQLAEVNAMSDEALSATAQAEQDAKRATKGQLAASGQMLASASQQLASTQSQLEAEKKAHAEADARAKDAMNRLAAAGSKVSEEPRGVVITMPGGVLFASGKDTLLSTAQAKLGQVAEALKNQGDHKIVVEGHTDSQGSDSSNQLLSERRAQAVTTFLVSRGVAAAQIRSEGVGESRPVADNASQEGRANNRRVEIVIQPAESR